MDKGDPPQKSVARTTVDTGPLEEDTRARPRGSGAQGQVSPAK